MKTQEQNKEIIMQANLFLLLETAIKRIEIANKEGITILAAWLPDAKKCLEEFRNL